MAYLKPLSKIGCIEIVKLGQSKLLLDRLQLLGDGATEAERRRGWAEEVERIAARERQAQAVCLRQGRALMRHGFGKLM